MEYIAHGILQARILKGVAFPFSRGFPNPGIKPRSPALQADSLPAELLGKPCKIIPSLEKWHAAGNRNNSNGGQPSGANFKQQILLTLKKKKGNQNPAPMDIQGLPNERGRHRYSRRFDQRCSECPMGGRQPHDLWSQDTTVLLRVKSLGHAGLHLSSYSESESQGGGSEEDDVKQT